MLLLGRWMDAHYGLVNKVVAADQVLPIAREWAKKIASSAPLAVQSVQELMREIEAVSTKEAFNIMRSDSVPIYRQMLKSEDAAEGINAFAEKRDPVFKGK